jgi:hypothetical protein
MVGETFNYEVNIVATGTTQNLLPLNISPDVIGAKKYPEKPTFTEEVIDGNIVTSAKYNTVYIPEKSGTIIIPKTSIKWFNLNTNKIETASVEEKKINVATNGVVAEGFDNIETDITNNVGNNEKQDISEKIEKKNKTITIKIKIKYIALALIILILGFVYRKNKNKPINRYKREVIDNIKKKNYKKVKIAVVEWAKIRYKNENITNFKDIIDIAKDYEFEKQLDILNKLLYSKGEEVLDVNVFVKTFKAVNRKKVTKINNNDVLPNLYK